MQSLKGDQAAAGQQELAGKAALIASVGGQRGWADWTNPDHRLRRLLSEFLGMAGLTFVLSGGAAILARYGGHGLQPWQTVLVLSAVSALWLVVAVYFLGDISAHFNPATTLAFALRRDMDWMMAGAYWIVQFAAAVCGSLLARGFFGPAGHLAATTPKPGQSWQAAAGTHEPTGPNPVTVVISLAGFAAGVALAVPILKAFGGGQETAHNVFQVWPRPVSIALAIAFILHEPRERISGGRGVGEGEGPCSGRERNPAVNRDQPELGHRHEDRAA